jgi:hypothetical protein
MVSHTKISPGGSGNTRRPASRGGRGRRPCVLFRACPSLAAKQLQTKEAWGVFPGYPQPPFRQQLFDIYAKASILNAAPPYGRPRLSNHANTSRCYRHDS